MGKLFPKIHSWLLLHMLQFCNLSSPNSNTHNYFYHLLGAANSQNPLSIIWAHREREQSAHSSQLEELCKRFDLTDDDIDMEVSNEHIKEIYSQLKKWRRLAVHLGLTGADIEQIAQEANQDVALMRLYMLQQWKSKGKLDNKSTYRVLLNALLECSCTESAVQLCELL